MSFNEIDVIVKRRPDNPDIWNEEVATFTEGSLFQSTHWGDYVNLYMGCDTYYVALKNNGKTVGLALLWVENMKFRNVRLLSRAYCFYGPLLSEYSDENMGFFLKAFNRICQENGIVLIEKMLLPVHFRQKSIRDISEGKNCFGSYGWTDDRWATILLDLNCPEDDLWENISYAAKKCLKKNQAEKMDVAIIDDANECREYCGLLGTFLKNRGMEIPYFTFDIWEFLRNKERCMEIFVAKQNGSMLGGIGILYFNGIVFEMAAWRSEHAVKNNIYAGDALKWEVIRWAKKNSMRIYDLTGVSPEPSTDKEKGIRRFKEKWGGAFMGYRYYSRVYRRDRYFFYNTLRNAYHYIKDRK